MKKLYLLIVCLFFPLAIAAAEKPVWVEAEGEARMSEVETPREVMERARRDAQSRAVEKAAGAFVNAHTLVSNSQLVEDLVYASVRGKVAKVEITEEGWDRQDRNLYKVKLRAFVDPVYPEKGEGISLKLSLSKTVLKEGEEVKIFYQGNRDCYVYIFSVAEDGSVTLLMPNSSDGNNYIRGGDAYTFPPAGSPTQLKAMFLPDSKGKSAEEKVKIIATQKKEELVPLGFREGMFKVYDARSTGMISDLVKRLNQLDPADWAEATAAYRIEK